MVVLVLTEYVLPRKAKIQTFTSADHRIQGDQSWRIYLVFKAFETGNGTQRTLG